MIDDRVLIDCQAETLFTYDDRGRMLRDNYPGGGPAPRLFVGRTRQGDVARFGHALPDSLVAQLAAALAQEPSLQDPHAPMQSDALLKDLLAQHAPVPAQGSGPTYWFPTRPSRLDGVQQITTATSALVRDTFAELFRTFAAVPLCFAVVRDGAAVSVCFSSRVGPRATEAEVETLPAFRGRGFAAAVTAAWAAAVQAAGGIPLYTTSWENLASQGVARRLGLAMYGVDLWWA